MADGADARRPTQSAAGPADFARRTRALTAATRGPARISGALDLMGETLTALGYGEGVEILQAALELDRRPSEHEAAPGEEESEC